MILRSLLPAGVLALHASAFLVPLEVIKGGAIPNIGLESSWTQEDFTIELACPGCTFAGPADDGVAFSAEDENTIEIHAVVENAARLKINGGTVYPLENPFMPNVGLTASQVRTSDSVASRPLRLGYALEIIHPVNFEDDNSRVIPLQLTILEVDGSPVHVDTVMIDLVDGEAGLSVARISTVSFETTPGAAECSTTLCRLRAIVAERIHAAMEAAKTHVDKASSWMAKGCRGGQKGRGRHGNMNGTGRHHGHHNHHNLHHGYLMHRVGHILHKMLRFFIVPALLGVIGGLLASALGMLVGQAIAYLWIRFHRGGQRGAVRFTEEVMVVADEKEVLIENEVPPPMYEDIEVMAVEDGKEETARITLAH